MADTVVEHLRKRHQALETERSSWLGQWQEINGVLLPMNGRFLVSDTNQGIKRFNKIYDNTATRAHRTLTSGLVGGATSPARPWMRLATSDADLMEYPPVKKWLSDLTKIMLTIFAKSNTYDALRSLYDELGAYATGLDVIEPNFKNVIHNFVQTVGEYCIANDEYGRVNTLFREFAMTAAQMRSKFGVQNLSEKVKECLREGRNPDEWITVVHAIEPRIDRDLKLKDARNMPFASVYYEKNSDSEQDKPLRESGYKRFPAIGVRWHVMGGNIYGDGPGMEALGDIKQLMHANLRKQQALDYLVKPPLQAPSTLANTGVNLLPGGTTYVAELGAQGRVRPLFDVRPAIEQQIADIQDIRHRIDDTFYKPLFLMLEGLDDRQRTATEIAERHEEKLLLLGPVLERLHGEGLSPLIDITFDRMIAARIVPPPPKEMQGQELTVEFISVLAQAQRAVGTQALNRLLGFIASVGQFKQEAWDKAKSDDMIDGYADMLGVDPDYIVANDQVAIVRNKRAEAQSKLQAASMVPPATQALKNVADAQQTAGGDLNNLFSGYSIPTA